MIGSFKKELWKNFGASIDMLRNAIFMWPDNKWDTDRRFFYNAYHVLVFLDYYLTFPPVNFKSPLPFTLTDFDKIPAFAIDDVVPDRIYDKFEMLDYAVFCRQKCKSVIAGLTNENINQPWLPETDTADLSLASMDARSCTAMGILFYNFRHVQHHVAQLNLLLRQTIGQAPDYISFAPDDL